MPGLFSASFPTWQSPVPTIFFSLCYKVTEFIVLWTVWVDKRSLPLFLYLKRCIYFLGEVPHTSWWFWGQFTGSVVSCYHVGLCGVTRVTGLDNRGPYLLRHLDGPGSPFLHHGQLPGFLSSLIKWPSGSEFQKSQQDPFPFCLMSWDSGSWGT